MGEGDLGREWEGERRGMKRKGENGVGGGIKGQKGEEEEG